MVRKSRNCLLCGVPSCNPRFCSLSCSARFHNVSALRRKSKPERACEYCGKQTTNLQVCNQSCQQGLRSKIRTEQWLNGENPTTLVPPFVRKYLYETRGEKCEICGWNEIHPTTGRAPLQVDHIDGSNKNTVLDNLRILCPNHHALTLTYCMVGRIHTEETRRKLSAAAAKRRSAAGK